MARTCWRIIHRLAHYSQNLIKGSHERKAKIKTRTKEYFYQMKATGFRHRVIAGAERTGCDWWVRQWLTHSTVDVF